VIVAMLSAQQPPSALEDLDSAINDGTVGALVKSSFAAGSPEALRAAAANVRPGPDVLPFLVGLSLPLVAV
jgi:hypothetical protein